MELLVSSSSSSTCVIGENGDRNNAKYPCHHQSIITSYIQNVKANVAVARYIFFIICLPIAATLSSQFAPHAIIIAVSFTPKRRDHFQKRMDGAKPVCKSISSQDHTEATAPTDLQHDPIQTCPNPQNL